MDRRVEHLAELLEVGPELRLLLGGDRAVVERRAPVGGALVHGERRDLVERSPGRPARRSTTVPTRPPACRRSRPARPATGRCGAARRGSRRARARRGSTAPTARRWRRPGTGRAIASPSPSVTVQVADGSSHTADVTARAEADVAPQVEPVDDVVEVALGLGLGGEVLLPLPLVEQLLRRTGSRTCSSRSRSGRRGSGSSTRCRRRRRRPRAARR